MTLSEVDPSSESFDWPEVDVPQGRYRFDAYFSGQVLPSNLFTVTPGSEASASCLVPPWKLPFPSSSTSSPSQSTSATSPIPVVGATSVNKGVIAGGVVSGMAVLALIASLALCVLRRRARARRAIPTRSVPRTKGQVSKALHNSSDSTGAILTNYPQLSEEDFGSEKSYDDTQPIPTLTAPPKSHLRSSVSNRRPVSMAVKPSFESHGTAQSLPLRSPCRSLDSSAAPPNKTALPTSPSFPSPTRYPSQRARRASRKPVPAYDASEFPSSGSDDIPLSGWSGTGHSDGTKVHYLIPDAPLEQRN